jgi:hypothetical protein
MTGSDFKSWNNISITYSSGSIKVYKNGVLGGSLTLTQAFTISQITLGGNYNYQSIGLGGQAVWDGYLRQICVFDSVLSADELGLLYTKTQDNTIIGSPLQMITALNDTLKNTTTVQSATDAINAAIAGPNQVDCTACIGLKEVIGHCRDVRQKHSRQGINCIYFGHKTTVELPDKQTAQRWPRDLTYDLHNISFSTPLSRPFPFRLLFSFITVKN